MSVLYLLYFVTSFFCLSSLAAEVCPSNVRCFTQESLDSCPEGSFFQKNYFVHGCCSGCVSTFLGLNEVCTKHEQCEPGLKCQLYGGGIRKCKEDTKQVCYEDRRKNIGWLPKCDVDGSYAAKQCRGEKLTGRCFCYNKDGKRIFGESPWKDADDMECRCSRLVEYLTKDKKKTDVTIHCDEKGNFDVLQCYNGLCWCADTKTGLPYTMMVPEDNVKALTCYTQEENGIIYYKRCDSQYQVAQKIKTKLRYHGTDKYASSTVTCDPDGSYNRVQIVQSKKVCVSKNNTRLLDYGGAISQNINCNCAYDEYVTKTLNGQNFNLACENSGNYIEKQMIGGEAICVDEHGFEVDIQCTSTQQSVTLVDDDISTVS